MYAIVNIAGKQLKVSKDQEIYAPYMKDEVGATVNFNEVYLVENEGKLQVGSPIVDGIKVSSKVLEHIKGDKVIVFKKKKRKGYKVKNGHRQKFTKLLINDISK